MRRHNPATCEISVSIGSTLQSSEVKQLWTSHPSRLNIEENNDLENDNTRILSSERIYPETGVDEHYGYFADEELLYCRKNWHLARY